MTDIRLLCGKSIHGSPETGNSGEIEHRKKTCQHENTEKDLDPVVLRLIRISITNAHTRTYQSGGQIRGKSSMEFKMRWLDVSLPQFLQ
jgi:hypothetical protein